MRPWLIILLIAITIAALASVLASREPFENQAGAPGSGASASFTRVDA